MKELRTSIEIDAPPARVWDVLLEFDAYPQWNPFLRSVRGDAHADAHLVIEVSANARVFVVRAEVLRAEPEVELRWMGSFPVPGILAGEQAFELHRNLTGGTSFVHRGSFRGVTLPVLWRPFVNRLCDGFDAMNLALKHRVERGAKT